MHHQLHQQRTINTVPIHRFMPSSIRKMASSIHRCRPSSIWKLVLLATVWSIIAVLSLTYLQTYISAPVLASLALLNTSNHSPTLLCQYLHAQTNKACIAHHLMPTSISQINNTYFHRYSNPLIRITNIENDFHRRNNTPQWFLLYPEWLSDRISFAIYNLRGLGLHSPNPVTHNEIIKTFGHHCRVIAFDHNINVAHTMNGKLVPSLMGSLCKLNETQSEITSVHSVDTVYYLSMDQQLQGHYFRLSTFHLPQHIVGIGIHSPIFVDQHSGLEPYVYLN
eukprot:899090_1